MSNGIERLFSGVFECGDCGIRYRVADVSEDDLFCTECGGDLEPAAEAESDVLEEDGEDEREE